MVNVIEDVKTTWYGQLSLQQVLNLKDTHTIFTKILYAESDTERQAEFFCGTENTDSLGLISFSVSG